MIAARIFPDDALFDEAVDAAVAHGWYLIGNGKRIAISPVVPAGWHRIVVKVRTPRTAAVEPAPCAA